MVTTLLTSLPWAGGEADAISLLCFADLVYQGQFRLSTIFFSWKVNIFRRSGQNTSVLKQAKGGVPMPNENRNNNQKENRTQNQQPQKENRNQKENRK